MSSKKTSDTLITDNTALVFTAMQAASEAFADFTSQSFAFWSAALDSANAGSAPTIPPALTLTPAAPPRNVQSPPFLSIVPMAPSPRPTTLPCTGTGTGTGKTRNTHTKTSTARSWYRKPVESPIETMMNFWGALLPSGQFSNPWLPGTSSPQPAATALGTAGTMNAMAAMGAMAPAVEALSTMTTFPGMPGLPGLPGTSTRSAAQNFFTSSAPATSANPWLFWQSAMPWQPHANSSATPAIADLYGLASASIWLSQPSHNGWTKSPTQEITDAWSWVAQSWSADPFGAVRSRQAHR